MGIFDSLRRSKPMHERALHLRYLLAGMQLRHPHVAFDLTTLEPKFAPEMVAQGGLLMSQRSGQHQLAWRDGDIMFALVMPIEQVGPGFERQDPFAQQSLLTAMGGEGSSGERTWRLTVDGAGHVATLARNTYMDQQLQLVCSALVTYAPLLKIDVAQQEQNLSKAQAVAKAELTRELAPSDPLSNVTQLPAPLAPQVEGPSSPQLPGS